MRRGFTLGATLLALMIVCAPAQAANSEICTGAIKVHPYRYVDHKGVSRDVVAEVYERGQDVVRLKGRGECKSGRRHKATCEKRAVRELSRCAQALWDARWSREAPPEYCESADNGRPPDAGIVWWNTRIHSGDIKTSIEFEACCKVRPRARDISAKIVAWASGANVDFANRDSACGYEATLENAYEIDCTRLRSRGLCERPVSEWGAVRQ